MRFAQKIDIIKATGLIIDESTDRLIQLNKIRNKYAHNLDYALTFEDIKKFNIGKIGKNGW